MAAPKYHPISVEDYLQRELTAEEKHEYLEGFVHAMSGARTVHNRIATHAVGILYSQLRGKPCEAFNSDMKIQVQTQTGTRFYYPDAMVVCDPNPQDDSWQDKPVALIEVLSESTRRTDNHEKRMAYLTLPSLKWYLRIEPDEALVLVDSRKGNQFQQTFYEGLDAVIDLPEIGCQLPLSELYANVQFPTPDELRERLEAYYVAGTLTEY